DAPLVAGALMRNLTDPIQRRVAQVDVRRRHIDLRAEHALAFVELAAPHPLEQLEILLDAAVPVRAVAARLRQRAAVLANLLRLQVIDVRLAVADQLNRE